MKNLFVLVLSISFFSNQIFAQTKDTVGVKQKSKIEFNLYGEIFIAADLKGEAIYTGFGGPKLGLNIKKGFRIGLTFAPSVKMSLPKRKINFALGGGVEVGYKNATLGILVYPTPEGFDPAISLGWKF